MRQLGSPREIAGIFRQRLLAATSAAALSITALSTAIVVAAHPGLAQDAPNSPELAQAVTTYDIPAQDLNAALLAFANRAGLQIFYDVQRVKGLRNAPLVGSFTPQQALTQLLAGTGIAYRFTGTNTVSLETPGTSSGTVTLDPVKVQSFAVPAQAMIDNIMPPYAGGQVATGGQLGLLGNREVMDTPFNQTNFTAKKAQDQQAKTVRDVLIDDPSVRAYFPDGSIGNDEMRIRGFTVAGANTAYGGLYGMLPYSTVMPELAERIEVLKGPSVMLTGMPPQPSIGGTINVVPKRAPADPLNQVTAGYASAGQVGGHVDVARRFGPDKEFGVRFNGVFRAGQTEIQGNSDQRALASLGLDYRTDNFRFSADLGYQYQYIGGMVPYLGVANNVPLPYAPDARKNWGQPWGFVGRKDLFGVVRTEIDLTDRITFFASFGAHDWRLGILSGGPIVTASNFNGTATSTPSNISQYYQFLTGETGIRAQVETGPVGHEIALTGTTLELATGIASVNGTPIVTNIYNPTIVAPQAIRTGTANKTGTQTLNSLALADTLSAVGKRIQLTVGARLQQVKSANFNVTTGVQTSLYDQSAISPSVSLVYKPLANVSIYGNWIQGLQPGSIVGSTFANAGEVFAPYKSTQYEAGVKVDWGKFTTTASIFQITQPSIITNVAANTQSLSGEQRNQGLELNVFGEPMEGVRLLGGVMFLSAVLAQTQGGTTNGWIAPFSPTTTANLGGEWDTPFAKGLTLNGRVVYTGSQYIDTTFPRRSLPEWTRFDIGARYTLENVSMTGKPAVLRFSVENLLDADYWASGGGANTLALGMPRTFRLSLTADF